MAPLTGLLPLLTDDQLTALALQGAPYARAFARVLPVATIVPALAMRGAPTQVRLAIAIALAAPLAPALPWTPGGATPLWLTLFGDALRGLPLAVLIATPLFVAVHVGAIADALRGAPEVTQAQPPAGDGARGTLATLSALLAGSVWLSSGGVTRALSLLAASAKATTGATEGVAPWALAARALTDGLRLGVAASAGVLVAMLALEAALLALGRAAIPLSPQPIAVVARPVVSVVALSLSLEAAMRVIV